MIRVCHSRSRFLSCMYIHDKFMTEPRGPVHLEATTGSCSSTPTRNCSSKPPSNAHCSSKPPATLTVRPIDRLQLAAVAKESLDRCRVVGATYANGWLIIVGASKTSPVPGKGMRQRHARRRILPSFGALYCCSAGSPHDH